MAPASPSYSSYSYSYSRSRSASPVGKAVAKDKAVPDKERHQRRSSSSGSSKERAPRRGKAEEGARPPKILHVSNLTRNVTADHLREIFGNFGAVKTVELAMDTEVRRAPCPPAPALG